MTGNIRNNNRMKILNLKTGKKLSLKRFEKNVLEEINKEYLSFTDIINRKILTRSELEKLIASKVLKDIKIKSKRYINRTTLFNVLSISRGNRGQF